MLNLVGLVNHGLGVEVAESKRAKTLSRHDCRAVAGHLYCVGRRLVGEHCAKPGRLLGWSAAAQTAW